MRVTPTRWAWDRVTWSSHCGNCIANCAYRLYLDDGRVVYEEVSGDMPAYDGVPDMNPLGCQKGAAWQAQLDGGDRLHHPLRRVGERGSGEWERIGWDDAFNTIADAVIDAIEAEGPNSIMVDEGAEGGLLTSLAKGRFVNSLDAIALDSNATVSDIHLGQWMTFGTLLGGSSADDTFHSDVILIWNANPAFTRIPYFHYLPEARYRGAHVVLIAPDYSPSAMHCDQFVSVVPGSDAALGLAMAQVILDENLADLDFVRSQTDLPLLVKVGDGHFLRESDMQEGGRDDRFYAWAGGLRSRWTRPVSRVSDRTARSHSTSTEAARWISSTARVPRSRPPSPCYASASRAMHPRAPRRSAECTPTRSDRSRG
ncbi:MAG: molybdopterin-dependent oxidoreductase [Acidimicrobiia bacterium]|nr:molybdopterin-dependent oxidoreductase [Acidimicrobiia bacterium]